MGCNLYRIRKENKISGTVGPNHPSQRIVDARMCVACVIRHTGALRWATAVVHVLDAKSMEKMSIPNTAGGRISINKRLRKSENRDKEPLTNVWNKYAHFHCIIYHIGR